MVSAARMHDFNKKKVHPSFRLQHREYIFPLLQGCIHQENIFFRCRRGAYIKKIYFFVVAGVHTSRKYIFPLPQRCIH